MSTAATSGGGARPAAGAVQGQQQPARADWKWTIARALLIYAGVNAVTNPNSPVGGYIGKLLGRESTAAPAAATPAVPSSGSASTPSVASAPSAWAPAAEPAVKGPANVAVPVWGDDTGVDLYVFLSSAPAPDADMLKTQQSDLMPEGGVAHAPAVPLGAFDDLLYDPLRTTQPLITYPKTQGSAELHPIAAIKWPAFSLTDTALARDVDVTLQLNDLVRKHNGSIWADVLLTTSGTNLISAAESDVYRTRKMLTRLLPVKRKRTEKNLFDKNATAVQDDEPAARVAAHWHRNLTLALVQDRGDAGVQLSQLPPPLLQHVAVVRDADGNMVPAPEPTEPAAAVALQRAYAAGRPPNVLRFPTVFANDFWALKEHMYAVNETLTELPLHIHVYHPSWFRFQMLAALGDSFDKQAGVTGGEIDMLKTMLLETNPWFLALTVAVSILHSLFEFLAFSSDVRHWKNKDDLAGVSVGSIVTNIVVQLIITLYLLDNNEDTSWMILAGQAIGVLIECWKLTKAVTVAVERSSTSLVGYRLKISDKHVLSDEEKRTQEYDRLAFKYVGLVVGPLLVCYTAYSAVYQTHRGWWSFIISTATSFVYAFGFVGLVPQLIVNYKLKSTAGMNSRTFVYKILGTFVDDLFAFCIKMPTLHRLACFRDDVVFFIALYQRWIYGVDPTRRNEFGQTLEKTDKDAKDGKDDKDAEDDGDKKVRAEASGVEQKKATLRANAAKPAKEGKQL
ncbi:transmembrane protein [Moesziomyces antarcticus T-34]|uniref:Transmembrane protein n=1 Tax=Pseudozyma antarctica (strain T-34) TaxID=1151754 RepID=M9MAS8_PSEA3|nr:transmembrane protein [Moesziomyces antarcticus T-34]